MNDGAAARPARVYNLLLFLSLGLPIGLLIIIAKLYTEPGWDTQVFCSAARAATTGRNPYYIRDLGLELSWNYQPYLLAVFRSLCGPPIRLEQSYPLLDAFLLFGGLAAWKPGSKSLLALALSLAGFWGFGWTLITGNITAVEFLLVSLAIALLEKRRWELAGLALGLLASIKLFTIIYVGLLLVIPESRSRRLRVTALSVSAFLFTLGLSYWLYPGLFGSFLKQILGLIPNQHNVWTEAATMSNVPLAFFLIDVLALSGIRFSALVSALIGTALVVVLICGALRKINPLDLARENYLVFFCTGLLVLTIVMPRLKPYSFLMLIPPLFYLIRSQERSRQSLIIVVSAILPSILFLAQLFLVAGDPISGLLVYSQTILLLLTLMIVIHFMRYPEPLKHAGTA